MDDEEQMVATARDRLNKAYQEWLAEHQRKEAQLQVSKKAMLKETQAQALKKTILKEARRVMNATSELEVLQVIDSPKKSISSCLSMETSI